jgi:hypothetical protein
VPVFAGHALGRLVGVDAQQLRVIRMVARRQRVNVQRPEALAVVKTGAVS